jgi:hypothetical protein
MSDQGEEYHDGDEYGEEYDDEQLDEYISL